MRERAAGRGPRAGGPPRAQHARPDAHDHDRSTAGDISPTLPGPRPAKAGPAAHDPSAWSARDLLLHRPGAPAPAVDRVTLDVPTGRCTVVIGPNGAGKSSLLRLLLGTLAPTAGEVCFEGRPVGAWERRALARAVGVVPQAEELVFPLAVRELVAMGRYPHLGPWRAEREADRRAVEAAMRHGDVLHLADRAVGTLSGGERQRALVARALAGEPRALVLDEPTAALDIRHEMAIFELLRALCAGGMTALVVTHHVNLAARFADRLVLMHEGHVAAEGTPAEVLTGERVARVYDWPVAIVPHPGPGADAGAPQVVPLSLGAAP